MNHSGDGPVDSSFLSFFLYPMICDVSSASMIPRDNLYEYGVGLLHFCLIKVREYNRYEPTTSEVDLGGRRFFWVRIFSLDRQMFRFRFNQLTGVRKV